MSAVDSANVEYSLTRQYAETVSLYKVNDGAIANVLAFSFALFAKDAVVCAKVLREPAPETYPDTLPLMSVCHVMFFPPAGAAGVVLLKMIDIVYITVFGYAQPGGLVSTASQ